MPDGSERVEYTMEIGRANLYAFLMIFPILLFFLLPFHIIWGFGTFLSTSQEFINQFFIILLVGVIVHELIHGITLAFFAKRGIKSIRFGMNWKWLTPYCHCVEPLKVKHYLLSTIMPLILMGLVPTIIAYLIGNGFLLAFGLLFIWAAGGDIISFFMLIKLDKNILVYDHPDRLGFYTENDH